MRKISIPNFTNPYELIELYDKLFVDYMLEGQGVWEQTADSQPIKTKKKKW